MQIKTRNQDNVTIVDLNGMLRAGLESSSLIQQIKQLTNDQDAPQVLIQMKETSLIDSCGVGELISSYTSVKKKGGNLKICGAHDRVAEVLQIVRLPAIIEVYDNEAEALASFG